MCLSFRNFTVSITKSSRIKINKSKNNFNLGTSLHFIENIKMKINLDLIESNN